MENRRQHYRIRYSGTDGARLVFGSCISEVLDCSERGLRFRTTGDPPERGTRISGRLELRHGKKLRISGTVARSDSSAVAIHLDSEPIPFLDMMREQFFLRMLPRRIG
jgi:hypothetical protein